jgi:sulfate adenylyltransferase subunit 1
MNKENTVSEYLNMDILRFTTAGSVDDGKSTLIGRLLFDSKSIFEDQLDAITLASKRRGEEHINLSLLTDGLKAEREQGITIDVAYRYFSTPKRKFIIADTPGHIQYTRNMVTGASTANLALILVDARNGVLEQTIRHAFIASLLRIPHIVFCINKMDLVEYKEEKYLEICAHIQELVPKLALPDVKYIPVSALLGDNIIHRSNSMPWYTGDTLIEQLEKTPVQKDHNQTDARFPVQYIIRPHSTEFHDYRGYAGRVAGGYFQPGDEVIAMASGLKSKIKTIEKDRATVMIAHASESVAITLEDDIDISRGDMIVKSDNLPNKNNETDAIICWFNTRPLQLSGKYLLKHTTHDVKCIIKEVQYKININTMEQHTAEKHIGMNDIARIKIKTTKPIFFDSYSINRITGSCILVDEATNETMAAGMIL